jgi:hypothetical protein
MDGIATVVKIAWRSSYALAICAWLTHAVATAPLVLR